MASQSRHPNSPGTTAPDRQAGAKIPDKPRDCGPNVDTWPILDEEVSAAPESKAGTSAKTSSSS